MSGSYFNVKIRFVLKKLVRIKSILAGSTSVSCMIQVGYDLVHSPLGCGNLG